MGFYSISPVPLESVSAVTATPNVDVGSRRVENGIAYVYCHNAGAAQISQGMSGQINTSNSGFSVSVSNSASQTGHLLCVGVAHNATIPTANYGWLATQGNVLIAIDATQTSFNAGVQLALGVDGGFVALAATLSTGVPLGISINSIVTTVGTGKAFFKSFLYA